MGPRAFRPIWSSAMPPHRTMPSPPRLPGSARSCRHRRVQLLDPDPWTASATREFLLPDRAVEVVVVEPLRCRECPAPGPHPGTPSRAAGSSRPVHSRREHDEHLGLGIAGRCERVWHVIMAPLSTKNISVARVWKCAGAPGEPFWNVARFAVNMPSVTFESASRVSRLVAPSCSASAWSARTKHGLCCTGEAHLHSSRSVGAAGRVAGDTTESRVAKDLSQGAFQWQKCVSILAAFPA